MQVAYSPTAHGPIPRDPHQPGVAEAVEEIGITQPLIVHVAASEDAFEGASPGPAPGAEWDAPTALDATIMRGLVHP